MQEQKQILLVEDEVDVRELISIHLQREDFKVVEVGDGEAALKELRENNFSLAILDWMLPGRSGLEITRWVRSQTRLNNMPVLMVTAKSETENIAAGLDAGADDYITKPFDTIVLMARVHALLRRHGWLQQKSQVLEKTPTPVAVRELRISELTLIPESFESYLCGQRLDLTRSEFRLLETLLSNQGRVLSRDSLIEQIQGEGVNVVGRTIDTHVFGLRKKLGDYADLIETIRGVGYRVRYSPAPTL